MKNKLKRILFITGTRADYGKLKPLMLRVEKSNDFICNIFITGMHMLKVYGETHEEIKKSGFKNNYLFINQIAMGGSDNMDMILSKTVDGLGHYIREFQTDLIIVHGDRVEALAGAIVGALNNILVCHIEGGELSGTVDELIRHSISKLSHIHFVANNSSKKRLVQMGESKSSIFIIGSPEVDIMLSDKLPKISEVKKRYEIPFNKYCIFIYHPVTTELGDLRNNIKSSINALLKSGKQFIIIYPNNDTGSNIIINQYDKIKGNINFKIFESLRFEYYVVLMKNADIMIGNSSAGVREASVFGVPSINIGSRQKNRSTHPSIINVDDNENDILRAINSDPKKFTPSLAFGKGNSSKLFMETISNKTFWDTPNQKQFNDVELIGEFND